MPKIAAVNAQMSNFITVPSLPWLNQALNGGFVRGGVYLLAGGPGLGKTTLVNQALGALASCGRKVLYISTEQSLSEFKSSLQRLHGKGATLSDGIRQNFYADESLSDLDVLPSFFTKKILASGEYSGVELIAIDSIQGGNGVCSNASRKYHALYEFAALTRAQRVALILVGHVTKTGAIAGPKGLEHAVDCILHMRRAFKYRPFFIPKNRFGPDIMEPIMLSMDAYGHLVNNAVNAGNRTTAYAYSGVGDDLGAAQALVSLPKYGERPELLAPYVPQRRAKQILATLSTLPDIDLSALTYQVSCYLPGQQQYRAELELAIAMALVASYLRRPLPSATLFAGELDLAATVLPLQANYIKNLAALLLGSHAGTIRTVFVAEKVAPALSRVRTEKGGPSVGEQIRVIGVSDVQAALVALWPDLLGIRTDEEKSARISARDWTR